MARLLLFVVAVIFYSSYLSGLLVLDDGRVSNFHSVRHDCCRWCEGGVAEIGSLEILRKCCCCGALRKSLHSRNFARSMIRHKNYCENEKRKETMNQWRRTNSKATGNGNSKGVFLIAPGFWPWISSLWMAADGFFMFGICVYELLRIFAQTPVHKEVL